MYKQKMELANQSKETIFNLVTVMTGRAWDLVEDLDVDQLADNEFKKVFDRLDKHFQFEPMTELPGDFEKFFINLNRRAGQTLQDYTQDFTHAERRLRTIHQVDLPEKVKAWYFLRRSGLSKEQRLMVLSSIGQATLDLDTVQKTMNFVIGQDTKLEGSRWSRAKDTVYYNDDAASMVGGPWNDEESWDWGMDVLWQDDDAEATWFDYDASCFNDDDGATVEDYEAEVYDVAEYDDVMANFVEARSKLNQIRILPRGGYDRRWWTRTSPRQRTTAAASTPI